MVTWGIYSTLHSLYHRSGVSNVDNTNNQLQYDVVIGLLVDALQFHIYDLVHIDSQLLVT